MAEAELHMFWPNCWRKMLSPKGENGSQKEFDEITYLPGAHRNSYIDNSAPILKIIELAVIRAIIIVPFLVIQWNLSHFTAVCILHLPTFYGLVAYT